ncbi:MAG: FAD-dependent thymidylate synthase [Clostridiaceae bacterium]|nr:FAD-dependent thymidylate synthase [Clostridiaceae bacterium]
MLKVKMIGCTPSPEKLVAAAARFCYSPADTDTIMDGLTEDKIDSFVNMLSDIGHESPIEHASFTFAIEGVSRSLLAQITRHRIASFSVQSQRYVKENHFTYVTPPEIENDAEARAVFVSTMDEIQRSYVALSDILYKKHIESLGGEDVPGNKSKAQKMAIEDARFVLPNACDTKIMMTMNARSLQNFFRLRCCNRAQWEIRELAWQMLELCRREAPVLFKKAGPACLYGPCSEGKMSCGKMEEVRKRGLMNV